jgi:parallel beta-helix repeat protein
MTLLVLVVVSLVDNPVALPSPSSGSDRRDSFYVSTTGSDRNNGSAAAPWATLQHAADMVKPGTAVHVAPGVYSAVTTKKSGTAGARIRFISDSKWAAKIRSYGVDQAWLNNGNYVDIMGFDISGNGRLGILNLGSFVRIVGNNVHDIPASCTSNGGAGIDNGNYSASDDDVIGNVVHDIGNLSEDCTHVHGIYHSNLRGHIVANISYRNQGWGIHLWHAADNVVIANNLVFGNRQGGIVVGAGDAPGGITASSMVVVNNMVLDHRVANNGIGIYEYGQTGTNNRYANNLVWNNSREIVLKNGLRATGTVERDPLLVNFKAEGGGDYHPRPGSPAMRAGAAIEPSFPDFDGASRPQNAPPDIGVFQSGPRTASWPWM